MGLGSKLASSALGAGVSQGVVNNRNSNLDLLRQRLAQAFTLQGQSNEAELQREQRDRDAVLGAGGPEAISQLGLPTQAAQDIGERNQAETSFFKSRSRTALVDATFAENTLEDRISSIALRNDLTVEQVRGIQLNNEMTDASKDVTLRLMELRADLLDIQGQAANLQFDFDQKFGRDLIEMDIMVNKAVSGELTSRADMNAARAALMRTEALLTQATAQGGLAGVGGQTLNQRRIAAQDVLDRATSAYEDFQDILRNGTDTELLSLGIDSETAKALLLSDPFGEQGGLLGAIGRGTGLWGSSESMVDILRNSGDGNQTDDEIRQILHQMQTRALAIRNVTPETVRDAAAIMRASVSGIGSIGDQGFPGVANPERFSAIIRSGLHNLPSGNHELDPTTLPPELGGNISADEVLQARQTLQTIATFLEQNTGIPAQMFLQIFEQQQ